MDANYAAREVITAFAAVQADPKNVEQLQEIVNRALDEIPAGTLVVAIASYVLSFATLEARANGESIDQVLQRMALADELGDPGDALQHVACNGAGQRHDHV